jgi:hypothetical protein
MPGLKFNPMMLLHGEQYVRINNPLAFSGSISNTAKVTGVYDKGKGVVLQIDTVSKDEKGSEVAFARSSVFIRGIGGYGGDRCVACCGAKAFVTSCKCCFGFSLSPSQRAESGRMGIAWHASTCYGIVQDLLQSSAVVSAERRSEPVTR